MLLAFIMVPLVQKELDVFRETVWNTHTHTEYEHRKIQYFRTEYQTTSITFQSNMTLKAVVSVIPLVYVKKKKKKKRKVFGWPLKGSGGEMDRKRGACNAPR